MPADTPAPSALDALLREVAASDDAPTYIARYGESLEDFARRVRVAQADRDGHAPRLAAIVRVLREAINTAPVPDVTWARDRAIALARAEAIAKGE